jgi:hypothetical protein
MNFLKHLKIREFDDHQDGHCARCRCLTPIILATWEAKFGRTAT